MTTEFQSCDDFASEVPTSAGTEKAKFIVRIGFDFSNVSPYSLFIIGEVACIGCHISLKVWGIERIHGLHYVQILLWQPDLRELVVATDMVRMTVGGDNYQRKVGK